MNGIVFSILVFILVALLLVCIVLIIINTRKEKLEIADLPRCRRVVSLDSREQKMLEDLNTVGEKLTLHTAPKMGLSYILQPVSTAPNADRWLEMFRSESVDFAMLDEEGQVKIVIMTGIGEKASEALPQRAALVEKACKMAELPMITVRDYNLPGLEKALVQKIAGRKGRAGKSELNLEEAAEE